MAVEVARKAVGGGGSVLGFLVLALVSVASGGGAVIPLRVCENANTNTPMHVHNKLNACACFFFPCCLLSSSAPSSPTTPSPTLALGIGIDDNANGEQGAVWWWPSGGGQSLCRTRWSVVHSQRCPRCTRAPTQIHTHTHLRLLVNTLLNCPCLADKTRT